MEGRPATDRKRKPDQDVETERTVTKTTKLGICFDVASAATTLDSGKSLMQAMAIVRQAQQRVIAIVERQRTTVDQPYYAGLETGLDPHLRDHCSDLEALTAKFRSIVSEVKTKVKRAPIYQLPPEILSLILRHLDLDSLLCCRVTCRLWNDILAGQAAQGLLWQRAPIHLQGTLEEINAKLRNHSRLSPNPSALSLEVLRTTHECTLNLNDWPTGLSELRISDSSRLVDHPLWNFIIRCKQLKLLRWECEERHDEPNQTLGSDSILLTVPYRYRSTACRLDELILKFSAEIYTDQGFVQMLSQVKRLSVIDGLTHYTLMDILTTAEGSLEELNITNVRHGGRRIDMHPGYELKTSDFVMKRLEKLCLRTPAIDLLSITAPQAKDVRFDHGAFVDWTLLNSCRSGIKILHLELNDTNMGEPLLQELFDMPQLEALHLEYEASVHSVLGGKSIGPRGVSTDAFWHAVKTKDSEALTSTMPSLKILKVCHDPLLDEAAIIRYIEIRDYLLQPPIEQVHVRLANHCSDEVIGLDSLQEKMPGFTYQRFDEWKSTSTQAWQLYEILEFEKSIRWDAIEHCRGTLMDLRLDDIEDDESLRNEIFNMPHLEVLCLSFSTSNVRYRRRRSASSLWTSMESRSTGNPHVSLRDILPALEILDVTNDELLDEDYVLDFVETRASLGLSQLQMLRIDLASICSKHVARLELLKKSMPSLRYRRYEDWYAQAQVESAPAPEHNGMDPSFPPSDEDDSGGNFDIFEFVGESLVADD